MKQLPIKTKLEQLSNAIVRGNHTQAMEEGEGEEHLCLNCNTRYVGNYCPQCGQSAKVKPLSLRHFLDELVDIFTTFDAGFFHTIFELCYRPGYMMRDYIKGHRREYVKPVKLLFWLNTILFFLHYGLYRRTYSDNMNFDVDDGDDSRQVQLVEIISQVMTWLVNNMAVLYLLVVAMMVLPNWLCFCRVSKPLRLTLTEHFCVMVYVACQLTMLSIVQQPFEFLTGSEGDFSLGVPLLLLIWVFHQLFQMGYRRATLLSILSGILSILCLILVIASVVMLYKFFFMQ